MLHDQVTYNPVYDFGKIILPSIVNKSNTGIMCSSHDKIHVRSSTLSRPRLRWMDDVREDLKKMGVTNWRIRAHRRDDWKMVVKEARDCRAME